MAEDRSQKSEKPTPRRRRDARRDGRVARSHDVGSWLSLAAIVLALPALGGHAISSVVNFTGLATDSMSTADSSASLGLLGRGLWTVAVAVGPLVLVATVAALLAGYGQVGFHLAPGALGFNWSKVSPKGGLKRIFSVTGAWEVAKMTIRLALLIGVGYLGDRKLVSQLLGSATLPIQSTVAIAAGGLFGLVRDITGAAMVIAACDYAVQRRRFNEGLKMTKEEVRRELRETEGNPETRRALRRRRRRLSRLQILAAVSQADVIVVNPTHFSVGLRYDRSRDNAPRVVTKGDDEDAIAIRREALSRGVPIVENPSVARTLYDTCEVGDTVPMELYQVVARLLAFVYRLTPAARALVDIHKMAS